MSHIGLVTYIVPAYDEAIAYFTTSLGFDLLEDVAMDDDKRWVVVAPPGSGGTALLLARAGDDAQRAVVGGQAGGRVFLFLSTDDFQRDHDRMARHGVDFLEEPRNEPYGTVAVFQDPYGHKWDLIEPRT